jgi:AcrR family transcriptional regulator
MNRPELRTAQRATVQDTILGAARKSLIEKGYSSFSMRGLAAEIGCSPGTIYLYFKSKEHLLSCVVEEGFDKLLEILDQVHDTDDPIHSLKSKLRAYVDFGLEFPHHYRVAFIVRESGRAVTSEGRPHASFDVLRQSVRACVDLGLFVSNDVEWASQSLWTAIQGVTSLLIVMPKFPWIDRDELIDGVIDTALDGLSRPSAKAT